MLGNVTGWVAGVLMLECLWIQLLFIVQKVSSPEGLHSEHSTLSSSMTPIGPASLTLVEHGASSKMGTSSISRKGRGHLVRAPWPSGESLLLL